MQQKDFFVGVYDPIDVRRNLLESSKEVIKTLQSFENLSRLRREKVKLFKDVKHIMSELDLIVSKLKAKLPKSHLRNLDDNSVHKKISISEDSFNSELGKLESHLSGIEKELSNLK